MSLGEKLRRALDVYGDDARYRNVAPSLSFRFFRFFRGLRARPVVDFILRTGELRGTSAKIQAVKAYRTMFSPLPSLLEAVRFVEKRQKKLGLA